VRQDPHNDGQQRQANQEGPTHPQKPTPSPPK
jgi:hypothetical protein